MKISLVLAIAMLAVAVPGAATASGPPQAATGTAVLTSFVVSSTRSADGNAINDGVATWVLSGTVTGTAVEQFEQIVFPDGSFVYQATGTVSGSAGTCGTGTMPFRSHAFGTFASYTGRHVGIDQASTSADVILSFDFVGSGGTLVYTGSYDCH